MELFYQKTKLKTHIIDFDLTLKIYTGLWRSIRNGRVNSRSVKDSMMKISWLGVIDSMLLRHHRLPGVKWNWKDKKHSMHRSKLNKWIIFHLHGSGLPLLLFRVVFDPWRELVQLGSFRYIPGYSVLVVSRHLAVTAHHRLISVNVIYVKQAMRANKCNR